jgi:multidrug efflux pump subunit AcrA (membrane-fusion protein)
MRLAIIWSGRVLIVTFIIIAVFRWGVPLGRQYFAPVKKSNYVPTAKVLRGGLTISFQESGVLQAEKSASVSPGYEGRIISIIEDGTKIKKGDTVLVLDRTDVEKQLQDQKLQVDKTELELRNAQSEHEILVSKDKTEYEQAYRKQQANESDLKLARQKVDKRKELLTERLIVKSELEVAELEQRRMELEVANGQQGLDQKIKENKIKEDQSALTVKSLKRAADNAKQTYNETMTKSKNMVVTAPIDGLAVILRDSWSGGELRQFAAGDNVYSTQKVCQIPDLSSMQVKVKVGESDTPKIRIGMPVHVRLESFPKKLFKGKVSGISILASEGRPWEGATPGKKTFDVTVSLSEVDTNIMKPGITADVEFMIDQVYNAVYVPIEAVVENMGQTFIYVKESYGFRKVPVKIGLQNDNFVIITKGLSPGQKVALREPSRPTEEEAIDAQEKGSKTAPIPTSPTN